MMSDNEHHGNKWIHWINGSAFWTALGVWILFSMAIGVTLIAPVFVDSSWKEPASSYMQQMYEVADPNTYISTTATGASDIEVVNRLEAGYTLLAFQETETVRIVAPPELEKYVTRVGEEKLKLTSRLLLLREPTTSRGGWNAKAAAEQLQARLQAEWAAANGGQRPRYDVQELYAFDGSEAFSLSQTDGVVEDWVDENYEIIDDASPDALHHRSDGCVYVTNPREYRVSYYRFGAVEGYKYDPRGEAIASVDELKGEKLGYLSRKELIELGEHTFAIEGCWYCHTDQTRTLVQDTILNGSDSYPAPPSSANEYVYQKVTFPGTRRIGPDISRVGVKRPGRDWHKSHFWSPKTASVGSIMPAFRHFFDDDPRGTSKSPYGVPNYKFEAVYQYLMTKGTRITPPTQAWWQGKDPVRTIDIIEGRTRS